MADPFTAALAAMFSSPMSGAATYTPPGGAPIAIRVIRSQPSADLGDGRNRVIADTNIFLIRRSEVPKPANGALIVIDGATFRLQGAAELDVEGMTWDCPAVVA